MFTGSLFDEQKEAAQLLCSKKTALLAWEQGTGKTVISVASIEKLKDHNLIKKPLVITLSGITWQWQEMIERFSDASVWLVSAKDRSSRSYEANEGTTTIVSWELFRKDYDTIINAGFDLVCADEVQVASNNRSKTSQLLKAWNRANPPEYRWGLTGTIISNKLEDLYAVFYWIEKSFLPDWKTFEELHIIRHKQWISGYKNLKPLHSHLTKRMDRKTHRDLKGKLPTLVSQVHTIDKTDEYIGAEAALLRAIQESSDKEIPFGGSFDGEVSRSLHTARLALVGDAKQRYCLKLIDTILRENEDSRVVVFSFYKDPLYNFQAELGISGISGNARFFTGDQSAEQKRDSIRQFEGATRVLLATNAGSTGLDLRMANHLVSLDVPFSYRLFDQRRKRITRTGSPFKTAVAHTIIMEGSIEHYFYEKVLKKGNLNSAVTEGSDDNVTISSKSLTQWILQNS